MLDWVMSKVAMSIAAVVLILTGVGYIESQHDALTRTQLGAVARELADLVDELEGLDANVSVRLGPRTATAVGRLPSTVADTEYTITVAQHTVLLAMGSLRVAETFIGNVHLWRPDAREYTQATLDSKDGAVPTLEVPSGTRLVLARTQLVVDGEYQWHTYLYPDPGV